MGEDKACPEDAGRSFETPFDKLRTNILQLTFKLAAPFETLAVACSSGMRHISESLRRTKSVSKGSGNRPAVSKERE
jgi:hypothetical protein